MKILFILLMLIFWFNERSFAEADPSQRDIELSFGDAVQFKVTDLFSSYIKAEQIVRYSDEQRLVGSSELSNGSCSAISNKVECHFNFNGFEYFAFQEQERTTSVARIEIQFSLDTKVVDGDDVAVPESLVGYINVNGTKYPFQGTDYFYKYTSYQCFEKLNARSDILRDRLKDANTKGKISTNLRYMLDEESMYDDLYSCQSWSKKLDEVEAFL